MVKSPEIQIGDGSLRIGDRVVYPNQGICRITGVEVKQIAGQDWEVVTLAREEDGATVMVPRGKVMGIGLRKVATADLIDEMFDYLTAPSDDPQLDWKVRHRENADKMTGGGLFGTAEVLKGLHALTRVRPLPQKERELYDNARHLLVGEIAAACKVPLHVAENNLDYALFPPPGMKRKGRELKLAVVPASGPIRPLRSADDDLAFEDELEPEEEAVEVEPAGGDEAAVGARPLKGRPLRAVPVDEEGGEPEGEPAARPSAPRPAPAASAAHGRVAPKPAAAAAPRAGSHAKAPAKTHARTAPAARAAPRAKAAPAAKPGQKKAAPKPKGKPAKKAPTTRPAPRPAAKGKPKGKR